jgi:hypothetical protein
MVPAALQAKLGSTDHPACSRNDTFSRVLQAYCAAWGLHASNIGYSIRTTGEDAPCLQLSPRSPHGREYTALEVLAILKALRYDDYFVSISFAHIALDHLATAYDHFGDDNICMRPVVGDNILIDIEDMRNGSILFQELSAVVMTGRKLRRLDFTSCIRRTPNPNQEDTPDDKGCGIVEPLYRLCVNQNTNLDWVILNGIHLSRADVEYVMGMLANRDCHLRAIELKGCHLDMWSIRLLLGEFPTQRNTLEVINISHNPGRLSPDVSLDSSFARCESLRIVDLSRLSRTPEPVSLIPDEAISSWRLEELRLSHTSLNERTVDTLVQ